MNKWGVEGWEVSSTSKKITLIPHLATLNGMTGIPQMQWQWLDTHRAPMDIRDQHMTSEKGTQNTETWGWLGELCVGLVWV